MTSGPLVLGDNGKRPTRDSRPRSTARWTPPLLLGAIGLAFFVLFFPSVRPPGHVPRDTLGAAGSQLASSRRARDAVPEDVSPGHHLWKLDALVTRVQQMNVITAGGAGYIKRMLHELRQKGAAAVPAIGDFLRHGEDVNFARMSGGELVGHRTLRQAMIDTLGKIGGSDAMAVCLEQVQKTTEPIELVMLARNLEGEEPGVHSGQVIQAIGNALRWAEQSPERAPTDVSPLFDLLRAYRGPEAVGLLEASVPQWEEYALIALAGLPDGAGIPSLTALAGAADAPVDNPVLPFQVLAQATAHYPEAGDALVDLAHAGQIPDQVWSAMGEALEGKHLQFSGKMLDGTPLAENDSGGRPPLWKTYYIQWLNVRYEEDVVSAGWSAKQVEQQLALIEDLREATSSAAGLQALQRARESLQRGRGEGEDPLPGT